MNKLFKDPFLDIGQAEKLKLAEALYQGLPLLVQTPLLFLYFWLLIRPGKVRYRVLGIVFFHTPIYALMTYWVDQKAWALVEEVGIEAEDEQRFRTEKYEMLETALDWFEKLDGKVPAITPYDSDNQKEIKLQLAEELKQTEKEIKTLISETQTWGKKQPGNGTVEELSEKQFESFYWYKMKREPIWGMASWLYEYFSSGKIPQWFKHDAFLNQERDPWEPEESKLKSDSK